MVTTTVLLVVVCLVSSTFSFAVHPHHPPPIHTDNYEYELHGPYATDNKLPPFFLRGGTEYTPKIFFDWVSSWFVFWNKDVDDRSIVFPSS